MATKKLELEFAGIDDWNRPIFKDTHKSNYYGDVNHLFSYGTPLKDIIEFYSLDKGEEHIDKVCHECFTYFGHSMEDDPLGMEIPEYVKVKIKLTDKE